MSGAGMIALNRLLLLRTSMTTVRAGSSRLISVMSPATVPRPYNATMSHFVNNVINDHANDRRGSSRRQ